MRRVIALLGALVLVAGLPAAASGAKATRFTDHSVNLFCDLLTPTSGVGSAFFSANVSDEFGSGAFVEYWTTSEPAGPPALANDFDAQPVVEWDGTTLSGSIPLRDAAGDPAGEATFSATLVPSGDPIPFDDVFKEGNQQSHVTGVTQPLDPSGTLQVGGASFSLDNCFADETTASVFATNPNSIVRHFSSRTIGCDLANAAGDTGFLFFDVHDGDPFVDVFVDPAVGPDVAGFGGGPLVDGTFDATLTVYDPQTGDLTGGTGSVHLAIASTGEPFEYVLRFGTGRDLVSGVVFAVEGSLSIDGHAFDLGACIFQETTAKELQTFPNGPKPGGKVPSNDLPSGAKLLRAGDRISVATKGASLEREADYECLRFEDPETGEVVDVPVGSTVWYKVVGTGGPITIDTAGSDYDTVIAVYTADGAGGFTPVPGACVDDVPLEPIGRTLQAAVTFDSLAGVTYYVQIGGYPQSFTYGNLRVRVS
jgi:hypothetical protein